MLSKKEKDLSVDFSKELAAVSKIGVRAEKLNSIVQLVREFAKKERRFWSTRA